MSPLDFPLARGRRFGTWKARLRRTGLQLPTVLRTHICRDTAVPSIIVGKKGVRLFWYHGAWRRDEWHGLRPTRIVWRDWREHGDWHDGWRRDRDWHERHFPGPVRGRGGSRPRDDVHRCQRLARTMSTSVR